MDRRQRALAAFQGGAPDRPPVCFWHHFPGVTGQDMVDAQVRFYEESGTDILKMMCDEYFFYPFPEIHRPHDWASLRPLGKDHPWIEGHVRRAGQIVQALGGRALTVYNIFAPFSNMKHAYGDAPLMADLRADEAAVCHAMDVIAEDNCTLMERLIGESGVDGFFLIVQNAEANRFTPAEYRRILRPSELRGIQHAGELSGCNILHMCGWAGMRNQLELWLDYPAPVVNLAVYSEQISLKRGKLMFPGRYVMGGFDRVEGSILHSGTPEAVRAQARHLVQEAGADRLIVSADCSLPVDTPMENLRAVVEALEA